MVYENSRGFGSNWMIKLFYLLSFMISTARLQTMMVDWEEDQFYGLDLIYVFRIILYGLISILGIFLSDDSDRFKEAKKKGFETLLDKDDKNYGSTISEDNNTLKARTRFSPEEKANIFSKIVFWWCSAILKLGYKRALEMEDLWPLIKKDQSVQISSNFEIKWNDEKMKENPSLAKALIREYGLSFALAGILKLFNDALVFSGPLLLNAIIRYISTPSWPTYYGFLITLGFFLCGVSQTIFVQYYFFIVIRVGMRIRSALVTTIYRKAFLISSKSRQLFTTGEIVNNMSIDTNRLRDVTTYLHMIWSAPLQISVSLYLLWLQVGPSVFSGVAVMIFMIPINGILIKKLIGYQKIMMINKDKRVKIMNEILQGIRIIKFFTWENSYTKKVNEIRDVELKTLRSSAYLQAGTVFSWAATPLIVSLATFTTFTLTGNNLTAEIAFTSLSLFNVLRFPLNMLPNVINSLVESKISTNRIQKYLLAKDRDPSNVIWEKHEDLNDKTAIEVKGGSFSWDKDLVLRDINFKVEKGEFVAVIFFFSTFSIFE